MRISYRIMLMALLLAACSGPPAQAVEDTPAVPTEAAAGALTEPPVVTVEVAAEAVTEAPAVTEAATEATAATEVSAVAAPTSTRAPRLELEATDPSTVSLAAGKPQLVEFFAFW